MGSYMKEPTSQDHSKDVLYSIKKSDYVGRYMVAARDIMPGEAIFTDQPACIGKKMVFRYYLIVFKDHDEQCTAASYSFDLQSPFDRWMYRSSKHSTYFLQCNAMRISHLDNRNSNSICIL